MEMLIFFPNTVIIWEITWISDGLYFDGLKSRPAGPTAVKSDRSAGAVHRASDPVAPRAMDDVILNDLRSRYDYLLFTPRLMETAWQVIKESIHSRTPSGTSTVLLTLCFLRGCMIVGTSLTPTISAARQHPAMQSSQ